MSARRPDTLSPRKKQLQFTEEGSAPLQPPILTTPRGAGSMDSRRSSVSGRPWWTQLDNHSVHSEEEILKQFVKSTQMSRLNQRILKDFHLDPEHMELLEKIKPGDAEDIFKWHSHALNFLRQRQSMQERLRTKELLDHRIAQKKNEMLAEESDEDKSLEDAEEEDDAASSDGVENLVRPIWKKSTMIRHSQSEAANLVNQRMAAGAGALNAAKTSRLQVTGAGIVGSSPRRSLQTGSRRNTQHLANPAPDSRQSAFNGRHRASVMVR